MTWPQASSVPADRQPSTTASVPSALTLMAGMTGAIGSLLGTTVSEARIIPVLYSPLISSTPRTPIASCANSMPFRLVEIGLKLARSAGLKVWYWLAETPENSAPMPIESTTAASSVQTVERSDRNLIHSDSTTRAWVTRNACGPVAGAMVGAEVREVVMPPPPLWRRPSGTPPTPP
jgi:hypothetical protein